MVRYLGDDDVGCPLCDGYGQSESGRFCVLCDGTGSINLNFYETPLLELPPRERKPHKYEIWSPLLCDESTIKRMTGESDDVVA